MQGDSEGQEQTRHVVRICPLRAQVLLVILIKQLTQNKKDIHVHLV